MRREWVAWLFSNAHYKLLSLALAAMAWAWVQQEQIGEGQIRARVDWTLPTGLMSTDQLPTHVTLTVRGTGNRVRRARDGSVRIPVDVSNIGVGEHQLEFLSFPAVGLPQDVEIASCSPTAMVFNLDEVAERKIAVQPVQVGDPGQGYTVQSVTLEPAVVQVRGARSVVASLVEVRTRPIDVSGLVVDAALPVVLELPRAVELADGATPTAHVAVRPVLERMTLAEVPVTVWQRSGWAVSPTVVEVTLEGPAEALERVGKDDVAAFVHLPETPERAVYEAAFGPSEGVRLRVLHGGGEAVKVVRLEPPRVEVVRR